MCYVLIYRNAPFAESSQVPRALAPWGVEGGMIPGRDWTTFYEIITAIVAVQSSCLSRAIEWPNQDCFLSFYLPFFFFLWIQREDAELNTLH